MEENKKDSMKLNKVRVLIFVVIIIILISVLAVSIISFIKNRNTDPDMKYVQIEEDGTKVNTSKKLAEKKVIDGIEINDITLKEKDNITVLEATALNTNKEQKEGFTVNIEFVDDNNQSITKIIGYISTLQSGESTTIRSQTTLDFANSYNINITKIEE